MAATDAHSFRAWSREPPRAASHDQNLNRESSPPRSPPFRVHPRLNRILALAAAGTDPLAIETDVLVVPAPENNTEHNYHAVVSSEDTELISRIQPVEMRKRIESANVRTGSASPGLANTVREHSSDLENVDAGVARSSPHCDNNLNFFRFAVRAAGPRFSERFVVAAESALHSCYRQSVLESLVLPNVRQIVLPTISSGFGHGSMANSNVSAVPAVGAYPPVLAAHVVGRTLRRALEQFVLSDEAGSEENDLRLLIIPSSEGERAAFADVLALYFPRNEFEEQEGAQLLPRDLGDPVTGELVIAERQIRIARGPLQGLDSSDSDDDSSDGSETILPSSGATSVEDKQKTTAVLLSREALVQSGLTQMKSSDDARRAERARAAAGADAKRRGSAFASVPARADKYSDSSGADAVASPQQSSGIDPLQCSTSTLLAAAAAHDHTEAESWNFIRVARPPNAADLPSRSPHAIVVVTARNIPPGANMTKVLLHALNTMNVVVTQPYSLLYCHSEMADRETPSFDWLRTVHRVFEERYGHNVRQFLILHPTFMLKMFFALTSPFLSASFKAGKRNCDSIRELFSALAESGFPAKAVRDVLAPQVFTWDMDQNGEDWSRPSNAHDEL